MRFPDRLTALVATLALGCFAHAASPEATRAEIATALKVRLPEVAAQDYRLGAAAIDAELRRALEENASAGAATLAAGKDLWTRKFKNGRTLSGCFPNGGRRVAEVIRATRPQLRVVYMSGYTDSSIVDHGLLEPGVTFVQKPFPTDTLLRKIREVLDAPEKR